MASPRFVNANMDALHFKKQTIESLNEALKDSKTSTSQHDTLTSTILLLIFLDILESGIEGWNFHLRGARGLVNFCSSIMDSGLSSIDEGNLQDSSVKIDSDTRDFITRQFTLYANENK